MDEIVRTVEKILNNNGYSQKYHYCIGEAEEQKVCLVQTDIGWKVFCVEKGIEFDVSEYDNLFDACVSLFEKLSDSQREFDQMVGAFKAKVEADQADLDNYSKMAAEAFKNKVSSMPEDERREYLLKFDSKLENGEIRRMR